MADKKRSSHPTYQHPYQASSEGLNSRVEEDAVADELVKERDAEKERSKEAQDEDHGSRERGKDREISCNSRNLI